MAERSKSSVFGSELKIAQVQILSVTVVLFISTLDLVLCDCLDREGGVTIFHSTLWGVDNCFEALITTRTNITMVERWVGRGGGGSLAPCYHMLQFAGTLSSLRLRPATLEPPVNSSVVQQLDPSLVNPAGPGLTSSLLELW
ncbi:hypothetical protein J6590_038721 [Homalodisca vitripennis]|nr:hypothetical protein J6590_038721 [Homalodisca vitripennis]